jgi:molecular chaperone GrpE
LEQLRRERDQLYDRLARLQAEFDNARKRATREQAEFREYASADAIRALLPIADSLERALQASAEGGEFRSGVELIYRQLQEVFTKFGVTVLRPEGELFDPRQHEAVEMSPTSEGEDNRVLQVLQPGYRLKDRLLRPAMVRVAKRI